ncbi:hypothetical protein NUH88_12255 [Nisaea acidiphila]|uniref:Uncharacterized protein n=1 Tax=Nisaea acidiphila TaxID=1862145 RepID=A0A9J7APB4_9PROT|nr:hypothetical protein [Nisaea acidiphila]UUX48188.1 hypothetical protein NUH88_12255 [Nisaea acidiphila]
MPQDDLTMSAQLLLESVEEDNADLQEAWAQLEQILNTMRAEGLQPPEDLLKLEQRMLADFAQENGEKS